MPKKCESCKHYVNFGGDLRGYEYCENPAVVPFGHPWAKQGLWPLEKDEALDIRGLESAREICDKEGDGIFVYFDPKDPAAGSAFEPECTSPYVSKGDTRKPGPPQLAMRATA